MCELRMKRARKKEICIFFFFLRNSPRTRSNEFAAKSTINGKHLEKHGNRATSEPLVIISDCGISFEK